MDFVSRGGLAPVELQLESGLKLQVRAPAARYAELATRSDTTTALVGIVLDEQWRVRRHALRVGGEVTGSAARLFLSPASTPCRGAPGNWG